MRVAAEKMKFIEQADSDEDMDVDIAKLQRRVIVSEQDAALKDAQILSMQAHVSNKEQTINQMQCDLEKKFESEFADKDDDPMNIAQHERTAEEKVVSDAEREASLNAYLAAEQRKKWKLPIKKQSNEQILIMKNQYMNPLDENFQLKDPTKKSDRYVMELGSSHYDKVGNKSNITSWRYDHDKNQRLVIRESGHREYYANESQFESWTKIDLQNLLHAPYHDLDPNQRGRGWAFRLKLEKEVKNNFQNMKVVESYLKKNRGVRDPHTKRTIKTIFKATK
ncbi:hypothetical protein Hanom_Chr16g01423151 [Helianthus anomalus]